MPTALLFAAEGLGPAAGYVNTFKSMNSRFGETRLRQVVGPPTNRVSAGLLGASLALAVLVLGCTGLAPPTGERVTCPGVAHTDSAQSAAPPGDEPDFTLHGFPQVGAARRFVPGTEETLSAGQIALRLPPDLYTEPLEFELLLGDERAWQTCLPDPHVVIAPYAYRVTDPSTGKRIGRFDKPVDVAVTDPRIVQGATYWFTSATNPPTAQAASTTPSVVGTTFRWTNGSARAGWFTTVPKG